MEREAAMVRPCAAVKVRAGRCRLFREMLRSGNVLKSAKSIGYLLAIAALSGCASTRDPGFVMAGHSRLSESAAELSTQADKERDAQSAEAEGLDERDSDESKPDVQLGSGAFINQAAAARGPAAAGAEGEVTFNFEGEALHAVIKAILGDFLQENYVVAPGVQGTVTFSTAKPLRGEQALSVLEMLLRWNNATLVWQDGRYTILPVAQALPGNLTPRTGSAASARGYEVRAIPLQYIGALEMEKLLKPYAKPEALVSVDPARNMIVLAGTAAELLNYQHTVEVFDVDWLAGMSVGTFALQQAEASKVITELEKIFGEGSNTPLAGMFRFIPLEGVNSIIVITPQPKYLRQAEEWIERIDAGGNEAGARLYVYEVKNVKAVDLAATLGEIFGGQARQSTAGQSGSVAPGLEPVSVSTLGRGQQPSMGAQFQSTESSQSTGAAVSFGGGDSSTEDGVAKRDTGPVVDAAGGIALGAEKDIRVSAVEDSNSLLIKATSAQWESIRRVIERLDQIPLQVMIEAQIVSVLLNDSLSYGVNWFFENGITDATTRTLATGRGFWGDTAGSIQGTGLTTWDFVGPSATAALRLLDTVTETKVLSAPSLMVLNNKSAMINVGDQIPVSSVSIGLPGVGTGTGSTATSSYTQYLQTGITLNVTPRVNPGGLVYMEIEQEDSTPGEPAEGSTNAPISTRNITSEIAVQSGQTIILGGLIKESNDRNSSGLPFLSRIPVLGGLFGSQKRSTDRTELLVMITPRVIASPVDAKQITEDYIQQFRALEPLKSLRAVPGDASTSE